MELLEIVSFYFAIGITVLIYLVWKINDIKNQIDCMHGAIHDTEESVNAIGTILVHEFNVDFEPCEHDKEILENKIEDWKAWEEETRALEEE